ncbi:MAG TPA: nucleotide-binding protein [Pyrinomonadaceae bacterium]
MSIARRIYISVPGDSRLTESQQLLKWALIDKVSELGYTPEMFYSERPQSGSLAHGRNWSFAECSAVLRRCVGAIIIGLPRHQFSTDDGPVRLPTEYAHIEGALAIDLDLPTFLLAEEGVSDRGMFFPGGAHLITAIPSGADAAWTAAPKFQNALSIFVERVRERRDIFLGYCGTSEGTAQNLKRFIELQIGATVLDWRTDFIEGRTIIEEIEEAARRTSGGVFLFTKDDPLEGEEGLAAPRDNVVFEAGFFAHAKGRGRVLIVREDGAKMPADLGGSIYVKLSDRTNIGPLETRLKRFLETAI